MTAETREEEINERLEEELDKQFPKGDKARGRALVLFAIAQQEIDKAKEQAEQEFEKMIDKRLIFHREVAKFKTDRGQIKYSEEQAIKEMNFCDELEELKAKLKEKK